MFFRGKTCISGYYALTHSLRSDFPIFSAFLVFVGILRSMQPIFGVAMETTSVPVSQWLTSSCHFSKDGAHSSIEEIFSIKFGFWMHFRTFQSHFPSISSARGHHEVQRRHKNGTSQRTEGFEAGFKFRYQPKWWTRGFFNPNLKSADCLLMDGFQYTQWHVLEFVAKNTP